MEKKEVYLDKLEDRKKVITNFDFKNDTDKTSENSKEVMFSHLHVRRSTD